MERIHLPAISQKYLSLIDNCACKNSLKRLETNYNENHDSLLLQGSVYPFDLYWNNYIICSGFKLTIVYSVVVNNITIRS